MSVREVTIFLEKKSKLVIFHLKCTKPKQNCIVCIAEHQTLKTIPQIRLIFIWITSLAHAKGIFKIIFGHNYFTSEPIFKIFAALFTTFGLQKDDIVIFFL